MTHISQAKHLSKIKTVIFDIDGVIWLKDKTNVKVINGAKEILKYLKKTNKRAFFLTNNSGRTVEEYYEKFKNLNFKEPEIQINQIISASYITANYLKKLEISKVFVMGSIAIDKELAKLGIQSIRHNEDLIKVEKDELTFVDIDIDKTVQAVVVGLDPTLSYAKFALACTYAKNYNCKLIATNPDYSLPNDSDKILPGGGIMIGAIEAVCQRKFDVICGKPNPFAANYLIQDLNPSETLMVGDTPITDLQFGINAKFSQVCLVLSGNTKQPDIEYLRNLKIEKMYETTSDMLETEVTYAEDVSVLLKAFIENENKA